MTDSKWFTKMFHNSYSWVLPNGQPKKYKDYFDFWFAYLTERCINIFKWKGLPFKQRFLEMYLIGVGYCGLTKLSNSTNKYDAVLCAMTGVTNYATEFTTATGTTPRTQVMFHIYGSPKGYDLISNEGVIAMNTQTRTPLFPLIEYYSDILAHLDLSIKKVAIKYRVQGLVKGSDSDAVDSITDWYKNTENGDSLGVLDENLFGDMTNGIMVSPLGTNAATELSELLNARRYYINCFWADIGINSAEEKRERLISSEVAVGFNRVQFNVSDMQECREETAESLTKLFGDPVSVELNPKLKIDIVSTQESVDKESDDNVES